MAQSWDVYTLAGEDFLRICDYEWLYSNFQILSVHRYFFLRNHLYLGNPFHKALFELIATLVGTEAKSSQSEYTALQV